MKLLDTTPLEIDRKRDLLFNANPICAHCNSLINDKLQAEWIDEIGVGSYVVHKHCASEKLCSILRKSMRKVKGQPDLRIAR